MDDGADRRSFRGARIFAGGVPAGGSALSRFDDRGLRFRHGRADDRAWVQTAVTAASGRRDPACGPRRAEPLRGSGRWVWIVGSIDLLTAHYPLPTNFRGGGLWERQ